MGMIMAYTRVDETVLKDLQHLEPDQIYQKLQKIATNEDSFLSLDKLWDGVHCLLTGQSAMHPPADNLFSEAILGSDVLFPEEFEEIITYIAPLRLQEILSPLLQLDMDKLRRDFSPETFAALDVYPDIWLKEDKEDLIRDLIISLEALVEFYKTAVAKQQGIIISIL